MMMMYHSVSSSIEMMIAFDGTNSEMCNGVIYIDSMVECYYANHV